MRRTQRARRQSVHRSVAVAAACLVAVVATACEPPPPDGRNLGVTVDVPPPSIVPKGEQISVTGTVSNHGSVPAPGATITYAVSSGFVVDDLAVDAGATCAAVNVQAITCTLDGPLDPLTSVGFEAQVTAGSTSGPQTQLVAAGSDGSEPVEDPNPNSITFATSVRPAPAVPEPVGIGGGRNSLGTGGLVGEALPGSPNDGYTLAVNSYCTDKVNGDRFQSGFVGGVCTGTVNSEYRARGYAYAIDVPEGRTSDLRVLLWDPSMNPASPIDRFLRGPDAEHYTFSLLAPDATPMDVSDNLVVCSQTFGPDTPFDLSFLGSVRWNELCTISPSDVSGRYLVQVQNQGEATVPMSDGTNAFGLAAVYASDGIDPAAALCDGQSDQLCPIISGPGVASIDLSVPNITTRVPLGPIAANHEGRQLVLTLFDPGEGGESIRVLRPSGPASWAPATLHWSDDRYSGSGTAIDVTQGRFNGRLLTITIDLAGYSPPPDNHVWQVEYRSEGFSAMDRTTWEATIVDVPVS